MMPVIRISDSAFDDLSVMAKWFKTKSPAETLDRVIRETMESLGLEKDNQGEDASTNDAGNLTFLASPAVTYTKIVEAKIDNISLRLPNWSSALNAIIHALKNRRGLTAAELDKELNIPSTAAEYENNGYKYYPDLGISYQGQSADGAWKEIQRIATKHNIRVHLKIHWLDNEKAKFPGKHGELKA